jgi:predicted O-methyltransferase YrrM
VARANIARAGLAGAVDVRCGRALDTLPSVQKERGGDGFDLIFIDADKTGYPDYWAWALRLSHRGTLIVADNVVRDGAVADAASIDSSVRAVRLYHALVAAEPRVTATTIQTVGAKGYDGLSFALVVQEPAR